MIRARSLAGASILAVSLVGGSIGALSCGYEDPASASNARGILNWVYPDALYVATAVWNAQQQGVIGRDQEAAPVKALLGYQKALHRLGSFHDRLSTALDGRAVPAFSIVFIGPMLWTHYELTGTTLSMRPHVDGPASGDVVIVTEEPVITALNEGRITPQRARELGLIRFYGPPVAVQQLVSFLDRMSPGTGATAAVGE